MTAPAYGARTENVRALALDTAAEGQRPTNPAPRVSDDDLAAWIDEGAARVSLRIPRLSLLPVVDDPEQPGVPSQETVTTYARGLVELYAAALLWDVTHPGRAGASGALGGTLRARYEGGLTELATAVEIGVERQADDEGAGAAAYFPPVRFTASMGF